MSPQLELALRLTAVALLLRPMGPWFVRPLLLATAVLALVSPQKVRSPRLWLLITAMVAIRIGEDGPWRTTNIYLLGYWTLAIGLSLRTSNAAPTLAVTSRWLLGLAFAFAVVWKALLSPDLLDGRFFRVTLLTDPRFGDAAQLIGGLSADELAANRQALQLCRRERSCSTHRLSRNRCGCALWLRSRPGGIVALEAAVALLMLAPTTMAVPRDGRRSSPARASCEPGSRRWGFQAPRLA